MHRQIWTFTDHDLELITLALCMAMAMIQHGSTYSEEQRIDLVTEREELLDHIESMRRVIGDPTAYRVVAHIEANQP